MKGRVYLIGAGPWDEGLITVRGLELIKAADVIVYDYLVNPDLLKHAKKSAKLIYVGKTRGTHTMLQKDINRLLVSLSKKYDKVARLKGGDPFIFGRGAEEALYLAKNRVPFEVTPGVTSAIAGPTYAGIPLTHRDYASSVSFITGQEDPKKEGSNISWQELAKSRSTLVFLMGVKNIRRIAGKLIANGMPKNKKAAIIQWATCPRQRVFTCDLSKIAAVVKKERIQSPALFVVGDVVGLRGKLRGLSLSPKGTVPTSTPLFGKRILITRSQEGLSRFKGMLEAQGASVVEFPTIEIYPLKDYSALDKAISQIRSYDSMIFTSSNGVNFFELRAKKLGLSMGRIKSKIYCIGPATACSASHAALKVEQTPDEFSQEGLIRQLKRKGVKGKRILVVRAKEARELLVETLKKLGAQVDLAFAYEVKPPRVSSEKIREILDGGTCPERSRRIDILTFTSSSTARNFISIIGKDRFRRIAKDSTIASIGPITTKELKGFGVKVDIEPKRYTLSDLTEAIVRKFK
ncbi:MAG: uroporphyrinogen-III C-methyltransferase [Candidatus Omnitrophica bacterium]|nr:uroporphyrinogen-III C-methyltransferase [Candidatus Omnitrophota bacterium]